jgi:hypothetical protein
MRAPNLRQKILTTCIRVGTTQRRATGDDGARMGFVINDEQFHGGDAVRLDVQ